MADYSFALPLLDAIGVIAFFMAFYYSHSSYRQTRRTAGYWLMFSIGMILGFFWAITVAFETLGIYPGIMDQFQNPLLASGAVILSVHARLTYDGLIKPTD